MKSAFLTIAIPTYNRGLVLYSLLESIFDGLNCDIEVLVCDNNSSDNTYEVCNKYLDLNQFRYFRNESNLGFDGNILSTINHCKSDYIWFLSDDDFVTSGFFNDILIYLKKHQPVSLLLNASVYDKDTNKLIIESLGSIDDDIVIGDDRALIENIQWSTLISAIILRHENINLRDIQRFIGTCFIQLPIFWFSSHNQKIHLLGSKKIVKYNGEKDNFNLTMSEIWFKNWITIVNCLNSKYSKSATRFAATSLYKNSKFNTTGIIFYLQSYYASCFARYDKIRGYLRE